MHNENLNEIVEVADTLDNLIGAMGTMYPAELHLKGLKAELPKASLRLKKALIALSGKDPWDIESTPPAENKKKGSRRSVMGINKAVKT